MKRICLLFLLCPFIPLLAQEDPKQFFNHPSADLGAVTMPGENAKPISPLFNHPLKDISISLGKDGWYYLTGSNLKKHQLGVMLWKSKDLKNWEEIGVVFNDSLRYTAPEIHYIKNNFYIVLVDDSGCLKILESTSGNAEGPYQPGNCLVENTTDPSLFEDDNGSVYLLHGNGFIVELSKDLKALKGAPHFIKSSRAFLKEFDFPKGRDWPVISKIGNGGIFIKKIEGKYYAFANEIINRMQSPTDDVFVGVAENIYGPYEPRYLAIPHASQTTVFEDPNGQLWATYSASNSDQLGVVRERPALVPLTFSPEGKIRPAAKCLLENSPVAGKKPIINSETMRDPSVTLGGDGNYYLVGTLDGYGYQLNKGGVKLWKSNDLKQWDDVGFIWKWSELGRDFPDFTMLWAPEIKYVKSDDNYYLTFSLWTKKGFTYLFKSETGRPEGPYKNVVAGPFVKGIDGFIFEDDDLSVYFLWGGGNLGKLNKERTGFESSIHKLQTTENHHVGYEGNCLTKIDGKYILFGAEWNGPLRLEGTYDMMYGVSDNILGPYTSAKVAVPHAGHGTVFQDKNKKWWTTMFGNDSSSPWRMHFGLIELEISQSHNLRGKN